MATKREQQKADYEAEQRQASRSFWLEYSAIHNRQITFAETHLGRASLKALGETIQECNRADWRLRMAAIGGAAAVGLIALIARILS